MTVSKPIFSAIDEIARRQIGLQFRIDVLDLHRAAAVPVLELGDLEAERLAKFLGGAVIGVAGAFQRAARIVGNIFVFAAHHSAPCRVEAQRAAVGRVCARRRIPRSPRLRALQPRVRGWNSVARPSFINRPTGSRIARPRTSATSQSCNSGCLVRAKKLAQHQAILDLAGGEHLLGEDFIERHRRLLLGVALEFEPMRGRLHHAFRINVARAGVGAFVAGDALPDDVLVAQQFFFEAHADQIDPVARVEIRIDGIDGAGIGARTALPAAVDEFAARQRRDLLLHPLVVVGDGARVDERAPVPGDVDAFDLQDARA